MFASPRTPSAVKGPGPIPREQRIVSLDIIRGVAVLGILLINIFIFGFADRPAFPEDLNQQASGPDFWSRTIINGLFHGKMRTLFCVLFGAGILLFDQQKRKADGRSRWGLFYNRMLWLVLFGLLHAHLLLFRGDILFFYGVFGMVVFLLRKIDPWIKILGVLLLLLAGMGLKHYVYREYRGDYLACLEVEEKKRQGIPISSADSLVLENWEKISNGDSDPEKFVREKALMLGSYKDVASLVRPQAINSELRDLPASFTDNISMMLLGMVLLQWGFFRGTWKSKTYLWIIFLGYGIGIPLVFYSEWIVITERATAEMTLSYLKLHSVDWPTLVFHVQRLLLALAHASFFMLLIRKQLFRRLFHALRAVGQMAFSNYILQTVLCTFIFFGYGFGLYDSFRPYQLYLLVLVIWIFQMIFSVVWLRYFRFGPMEWLWRSLTYLKLQPMRRKG